MSNIKKDYVELYNLLLENKNKKVATILPELVAFMTAKNNQKTFLKDEDGNVTHVYCYYHKEWEDITVAEYGAKSSNKATGLNTLCKEGASQWNKQQRVKKQRLEELTNKILAGEASVEEGQVLKVEIEAEAKQIVPRADGHIAEI